MPDSAQQAPTQIQQVTDLALSFVGRAQEVDADVSVFFNALAMAFITSYIGSRTAAGHDVEESDLASAINRFTGTVAAQAEYLLNYRPEILKSETFKGFGDVN